MSRHLRPLTAPTPDFFQTNPLEHDSLLLEAKLTYGERPKSPDNLRQWTPIKTTSSLSSSVLLTGPGGKMSKASTIRSTTLPIPSNSSNYSFDENDHISGLFDAVEPSTSASVSSTPRSIRSKSLYFATQAKRYVLTSTKQKASSSSKSTLVRIQNEQLRQKFQLLTPIDSGDHLNHMKRPRTTGGYTRRPSHDRETLLDDMKGILNHVKTLRGISIPGEKNNEEDRVAKELARRAQRESAVTRQPGDMRGLSGRVRVDYKLNRFRDPNQLAVLLNSLGMKWGGNKRCEEEKDKKGKGKGKGKGKLGLFGNEMSPGKRSKNLVTIKTPRTKQNERKSWGNKIRERQQKVKIKRAEIIQAELQRIYDVGSTFKAARKQKARDDRLSERKIARGWNKVMWRYIACQHFSIALERGREIKRIKLQKKIAQIKISRNYRRKVAQKELKIRRRADYLLKFHLKRVVKKWKARRRKHDANILMNWLITTNSFAKRVLGYNLLKNSAIRIQTAWKTFRLNKINLIKKLSIKMYEIASANHNYLEMRRTTLEKLPALSSMPLWEIRYELLGNIIRPIRKEWMDTAMPKYNLDRINYLNKKARYERQKKEEEIQNKKLRSKIKSIDLNKFLIAPVCPKFHGNVSDAELLLCWKNAVILTKKPFKWKEIQNQIQEWLRDRKASGSRVN